MDLPSVGVRPAEPGLRGVPRGRSASFDGRDYVSRGQERSSEEANPSEGVERLPRRTRGRFRDIRQQPAPQMAVSLKERVDRDLEDPGARRDRKTRLARLAKERPLP